MSLHPAMQGSHISLSAVKYYIWSPETVLIVGHVSVRPVIQTTESKMQVTENFWAISKLNPV